MTDIITCDQAWVIISLKPGDMCVFQEGNHVLSSDK